MITSEEEMRRKALYNQGLSDGEIVKEVGLTRNAICKWRKKRELPAWFPAYRVSSRIGYPMRQALPPEKCAIMWEFLYDLLECTRTLPPGAKLDVSAFLREWRKMYSYSCSESIRTRSNSQKLEVRR